MRVKRFTARDMTQALRLVRQSLGTDAVILSTGRLPDGQVEVAAAVDNSGGEAAPAAASAAAVEAAFPAEGEAGGEAPRGDQSPGLAALSRRVEGLGEMLSRQMIMTEAAFRFGARPEVAVFYHHLMEQEVDTSIISQLLDGLSAPGGQGILPRLAIRIKKLMNVSQPVQVGGGEPLIWALVGPTGVGKTTTVAKLAAIFALKHHLRVGMITVDTYRMAAAEQLKVYGRIMEVPTRVSSTAAEFADAVDDLHHLDVILVDTVGRSPGDDDNLREMAAVLSSAPSLQSHLVLSCPTRSNDMDHVIESFGRFKLSTLIFTKLDETRTFGPILNQVVHTGLPVSYLTFGQRVPDDLEPATREGLAKRILPARGDLPGE